ncbi:uncharacterized protein BX663DRAFT_506008 [Cokeromyces recurvatus]|uniref:uncharacterized protein n=1 Tax=Cokeromyces recurvatus TaxID=90255 RepID=UPI00221F78A9|nr:uncharacterized protein BX663DRAFT_506008 [Cokeromyces recurvatus]KAI7903990.1 hypothetical protein BX663DRAFT_506008 [Cokeromyces recurvatus]
MGAIFLNMSTAKTFNLLLYIKYITYTMLHLKEILSFNGLSILVRLFVCYQNT